jgi:hypothetical protein
MENLLVVVLLGVFVVLFIKSAKKNKSAQTPKVGGGGSGEGETGGDGTVKPKTEVPTNAE